MQVHLTFDIETWCNGWHQLDARFPAAFERGLIGRSAAGDYALPKTLQILNDNGLRGVFFVESLFALRFGQQHLDRVVQMIDQAGHDVQLHVHAEWANELPSTLFQAPRIRRSSLASFGVAEQVQLIGLGKQALERALGRPVQAFRAGNYRANQDTYRALQQLGLLVDSSPNQGMGHALPSGHRWGPSSHVLTPGLVSYPITTYRDGLGRLRHAQVGSCSLAEMQEAMIQAWQAGLGHFVVVSHNFEMLQPGSSQPDWVVVRRFEDLCQWLADNEQRFDVVDLPAQPQADRQPANLSVSWQATAKRWQEQLTRRWLRSRWAPTA